MGTKPKKSFKSPSNNSIKLALTALTVLISFLIVGKLLEYIYSLNQPINPNLSYHKTNILNDKTNLNFLFVFEKDPSTNINVVSYQPKNNQVLVLNLSDQIYVDVPKEYGAWKVGSIYALGQEEKPQIGLKLLSLASYKLTGLPIDGVFFISNKQKDTTIESLISSLRQNSLSTLGLINNTQSDLTKIETWRIFRWLASVRPDKVINLNLAKSTITDSKLLPDSSRVLGVDSVKLDTFIRDQMADNGILDEGYSVGVFNATDHPGMGSEASRIITNVGGNVVTVANTEQKSDKTKIILNPQNLNLKNSISFQRFSQIFAPNCLKSGCFFDDNRVTSSRAQINLILGEDFYNFWHKR